MEAAYSKNEKQKMRSMRTVESTALKSRNCFPIFLDKEACCYKLLILQCAATSCQKLQWSIQIFVCVFEKMLNVFRDELRVIETHRMEDTAPLMDPRHPQYSSWASYGYFSLEK